MKVMVCGAGGYIGVRLVVRLIEQGHEVIAMVRSIDRFRLPDCLKEKIKIIEGDLERLESLSDIPDKIDCLYFLVHAMTQQSKDFYEMEELLANNFIKMANKLKVESLIYLSGITNRKRLSKHLSSRKNVEEIIIKSGLNYTILQAGIIIGAGSASFEIIRDLVEKLPFMIAPKWVKNRCQTIGIYDVIFYLTEVLGKDACLRRVFEIGGPELMTYKEILLNFSRKRGLKRYIIDVPVLTPRLSSLWLYFMTSTNFFLARSLVDSMENEVIRKDFEIDSIIDHKCLSFEDTIDRAFQKIDQNETISGWQDSIGRSRLHPNLNNYARLPKHGCLSIKFKFPLGLTRNQVIQRIWRIGGKKGWYYCNWIWKIRGGVDKLLGGTGLRRGRSRADQLSSGDALDFWRVLIADKEKGRLLLFAEMIMPGEAWLEFCVSEKSLTIQSIFRPKGLFGRVYWWILYPIHIIIFRGMTYTIAAKEKNN